MERKTLNSEKEKTAVSASELAEEIALLLPDYFEGTIARDESGITVSLPSGKKFQLKVTEI